MNSSEKIIFCLPPKSEKRKIYAERKDKVVLVNEKSHSHSSLRLNTCMENREIFSSFLNSACMCEQFKGKFLSIASVGVEFLDSSDRRRAVSCPYFKP